MITDFVKNQKEAVQKTLDSLAFKRLQYTKEIEKIDDQMKLLNGALEASSAVQKELETNTAVEEAKAATDKKIGEK